MVNVNDCMSKTVVTIDKKKTVHEAVKLMSEKKISCLIVMENNVIVGIFTLRDIADKVVLKKLNPDTSLVEEHMMKNVKTVEGEKSLLFAVGIMNTARIKQLPVVNNGKLVGIITHTDIIKNVSKVCNN